MQKVFSAGFIILFATVSFNPTAAQNAYPGTTISSSLANNKQDFWRAVMAEFYGKYDRQKKCWLKTEATQTYCMRPHVMQVITSNKTNFYYVVVGGKAADKSDDEAGCHACGGFLGFLVFVNESQNLGLVAQSKPFLEFGSWGQIPAEENFVLHQLGRGINFGWAVSSSFTGQGTTYGTTSLFAILGDAVTDIGQLPLSYDNNGNCESGVNLSTNQKCSSYSFETIYNASESDAKFAPVTIMGSGTREGATFTTTYQFAFDSQKLTYVPPANLPEELQN